MAGTLPIAQAHPDSDAYLTQNPAILQISGFWLFILKVARQMNYLVLLMSIYLALFVPVFEHD